MNIIDAVNRMKSASQFEAEACCRFALPVLAYQEESHVFTCIDRTVAFGFICTPLAMANEELERRINSLLNYGFPANTHMQFLLFRSPDVNFKVQERYVAETGNGESIFSKIEAERISLFKKMASAEADSNEGRLRNALLHDLKLIITVKVPYGKNSHEVVSRSQIQTIQTDVMARLECASMRPIALSVKEWKSQLDVLLSQSIETCDHQASGDVESHLSNYDNSINFAVDASVGSDYVRVGGRYLKCLSAKRLPPYYCFGQAIGNTGDHFNGMQWLRSNYLVCANVVFPDHVSEKYNLYRKRRFLEGLSTGPFSRLTSLKSREAKKDFDCVLDSLESGHRPLKIAFHLVLLGGSKAEIDEAAELAKTLWKQNEFDLLVDKLLQWPILQNCLPLCGHTDSRLVKSRFKTMTARQAATLVPIFGEWKGTGTPDLRLIARSGQMMSFSLHDSYSNSNAVVAGVAGSGRTFLISELITNHLNKGDHVWAFDDGCSFKQLCEMYEGTFHCVESSSASILNVASSHSIDADRSVDNSLVSELIFAIVGMEITIKESHTRLIIESVSMLQAPFCGQKSLDKICDYLGASSDPAALDIVNILYAFSTNGHYAGLLSNWNDNRNNSGFSVFELSSIRRYPRLMCFSLMSFMVMILQRIARESRSKKQIIIINEFSELIGHFDISRFMQAFYRISRKYNVSIVVVARRVNDLFMNATGRIISSNSSSSLFLMQHVDVLQLPEVRNAMGLKAYEYEQIKSLRTIADAYSEVFIRSDFGSGVGRLILSDIQKLIYSCRSDDVFAIRKHRESGKTRRQALDAILSEKRAHLDTKEVA